MVAGTRTAELFTSSQLPRSVSATTEHYNQPPEDVNTHFAFFRIYLREARGQLNLYFSLLRSSALLLLQATQDLYIPPKALSTPLALSLQSFFQSTSIG